jgi:hypothetical protein
MVFTGRGLGRATFSSFGGLHPNDPARPATSPINSKCFFIEYQRPPAALIGVAAIIKVSCGFRDHR